MSDDPLAPLKARFRARCGDDAARLRTHLAGSDEPDLEGLVHRLAGAAGTFGYADISEAALAIDDVYVGGGAPSVEALADLAERLERLAAS